MEKLIFPVTKKAAGKSGKKYSSEENKNALFPSQLRELRGGRGISQETLARDLGVSKSTIGLYETGDTLPDAQTLHDLAVYFGVSADWLLGLSDYRDNRRRGITLEGLGFSEAATKQIASIAGAVLAAADFGDQANKKASTVNNPRGFTCQQEARAFLALNILLENPEFVLALSNAWAYMRYTGQFDLSKDIKLGGKELPEPFSATCGVLVDALWNRVAEPLRGILDDVAQKVAQGAKEIDLPEQEGKTKSAPGADNTGDGHREQKL